MHVNMERAFYVQRTSMAAVKVRFPRETRILIFFFFFGYTYWLLSCLWNLIPHSCCVLAAPSQQPAPVAFSLNFSSINLSRHQPDSPNSNVLSYTLIRDRQPVHSIQRSYPFGKCAHWIIPFSTTIHFESSLTSFLLSSFWRCWIIHRHQLVSLHQLFLLANYG